MHPAPWIPDWVPDAIFYQIFPERFFNGDPGNDPPGTEAWGGTPTRENCFGGDLAGIIDKLDYLAHLGVNALYLNPIFTAGTNHKYDTSDYLKIDPAFGDDATFDRFIREAHARDIRVVLDGVFNHCGTGFAPFRDVLANGAASRYRDWFTVYDFPVTASPEPNYATCGGAAYLPRLNTRNADVRAFIHQVARHWLERGIDGWRLDVAYEIEPDFWREFRRKVKADFPDAYLVAEEWRDPWTFLQGDTFDGAMHYGLRNLAFDYLVTSALAGDAFARALELQRSRMPEGTEHGMLTLLGSHDTPRLLTECNGNVDLAKLLFTLLFTFPGAPSIYYGDENGMTGANDPDCRRPMEWDAARWATDLRDHVTRMIQLRQRHPSLRRGTFRLVYADDRIVSYQRADASETVVVLINSSRVERSLSIAVELPNGTRLADEVSGRGYCVTGGCLALGRVGPLTSFVLAASAEPAS